MNKQDKKDQTPLTDRYADGGADKDWGRQIQCKTFIRWSGIHDTVQHTPFIVSLDS